MEDAVEFDINDLIRERSRERYLLRGRTIAILVGASALVALLLYLSC